MTMSLPKPRMPVPLKITRPGALASTGWPSLPAIAMPLLRRIVERRRRSCRCTGHAQSTSSGPRAAVAASALGRALRRAAARLRARRRGFGLRELRERLVRIRHAHALGSLTTRAGGAAAARRDGGAAGPVPSGFACDGAAGRLQRRRDHCRSAGARHAQLLADAHRAGIVDPVPDRELAVVEAVLERDAVQRIAGLDGIDVGRASSARARAWRAGAASRPARRRAGFAGRRCAPTTGAGCARHAAGDERRERAQRRRFSATDRTADSGNARQQRHELHDVHFLFDIAVSGTLDHAKTLLAALRHRQNHSTTHRRAARGAPAGTCVAAALITIASNGATSGMPAWPSPWRSRTFDTRSSRKCLRALASSGARRSIEYTSFASRDEHRGLVAAAGADLEHLVERAAAARELGHARHGVRAARSSGRSRAAARCPRRRGSRALRRRRGAAAPRPSRRARPRRGCPARAGARPCACACAARSCRCRCAGALTATLQPLADRLASASSA